MTTLDPRCGTNTGYMAHVRRREPACEACRTAHADYVAEKRRANPDLYAQNQENKKARQRALFRLGQLHPGQLQELYREELRKNREAS